MPPDGLVTKRSNGHRYLEGDSMRVSDLHVQSIDGEHLSVDQISAGRAGIMVLVRHYGCIFCRQRIAELVEQANARPALDLAIMVVGNGTSTMAADFVNTHQITVPVYTDPSRKIYKALGMKRMFGINWTSIKQGIAAYKDGHRQTAVQGDVWQQGGIAVFNASGDITYVFADEEAGSAIPWEDVWLQFAELSTRLIQLLSESLVANFFFPSHVDAGYLCGEDKLG